MSPQAPKLNAKIKIHKLGAPIRPVISSIYAPTHKLAMYMHQKLNDYLKYIINTTQFAENLSKLKLNLDHKLLTMDINYICVKVPINYTPKITNKLLKNNRIDEYIIREIMSILKMIMNQNYFQYDGKFYKPSRV
jgi:hypothetical protein